jgi:predicted 3-demethylubiquinone-9 3-methyltransferase (glyoxalase superfamily)
MQGKKIQPISFWYQGASIQANSFYLQVVNDNTYNSCQIQYFMQNETTDALGNNTITILQSGNLTVNGADYISYNTSPNGNDYLYTWSGQKLNLTFIP